MPSTEACSAGSRPQGQSTVCVCGGAWPADALADATQGSKRGFQSHLRETTVPVTLASSAWGLGCAGQRCRACLQDGPGKRLGWGGAWSCWSPVHGVWTEEEARALRGACQTLTLWAGAG